MRSVRSRFFARARQRAVSSGPLDIRVGCAWRDPKLQQATSLSRNAPAAGFVRYRQQMAAAGMPVTFRLPPSEYRDTPLKILVRYGCIGVAAMSGRFASGGIVTSSNPQCCGNRSDWWGFKGVANVDGVLRDCAGPGLLQECAALPPVLGSEAETRLLPGSARATGAHGLLSCKVIHVVTPTSYYTHGSEQALRRAYASCLRLAGALDLASLAVPALGCGISGFPAAVGARTAFDALEEAEAANEAACLERVEFVLLDDTVYAAFADEAHVRWGRTRSTAVDWR